MSLAHQPCPDCGSSDALMINDDGSTKCFSCDKFTPAKNAKNNKTKDYTENADFIKGTASYLPHRNINQETTKRYKYNISNYAGRPCEVATYRNLDGEAVFQKVRFTDKKEFLVIGKYKPLLYGMHLFKGNNKKIIITEGEIDCLSISQIVGGYPVVSIPMGCNSGVQAIKENLKWLEQFEEVILCFDMDEAGQKAVKECAPLFTIGKCKIMNLPLKDPNEMLKANRGNELYKAVWNATEYRPEGILTTEELWEEVNKKIEWGLSYPFEGLTNLTYGIRKSEMIVFGAGTGSGKTDFFKEIEHHLIVNHNKKVGIFHLEESAKDTALGLMSKHAGIPFHIPDSKYTQKEFKKAFDETIGTGNAKIFNGYGTTDFELIKSIIRYFAKGCDCEYIFLDHITAFIDGIQNANEVNQKARNIILDLASLTRELGITLYVISHLKKCDSKPTYEEGGQIHLDSFYGSSALKQWVSYAFGLERNQQAEDKKARNTTTIRCLKDRYTGRALGRKIYTLYDDNTTKLSEVSKPATEAKFEIESEEEF